MKNSFKITALSLALLGAISTQAVDYIWNNSVGDNNFITAANWNSAPTGGNNYWEIDKTGSNKSVMSSGSSLNLSGLHIGYSSANGEFEQTGGTLTATFKSSAASRIGNSGKTGMWTMSGGTASINAMQLGFSGSTGNLIITGGAMTLARGSANYSLIVGFGGTGNVEISGGSLISRTGVWLQNNSTFSVLGSAATRIGIGSHNTVDGRWVQEAGGILKCRIDSGGVTRIFIDDTGSAGSEDGNVTGDGQQKGFTQETGTPSEQFYRVRGSTTMTQPPEGL